MGAGTVPGVNMHRRTHAQRPATGAAAYAHHGRPAGPPHGRRPGRHHRHRRPAARVGGVRASLRLGHPGDGARLPHHRAGRAPEPSPSTPPATSTRACSSACAAASARCASAGPPTATRSCVDNAKLYRVFYVKVTTPTTKLGSRAGWYPDPLVPRDFGAVQSVPGSVNPGPTTPFYILVHVPLGTPAGALPRDARGGGGRQADREGAVRPARLGLRLGSASARAPPSR